MIIDKLTAIDNILTLWLAGELTEEDAYGFIEVVMSGESFII